MTPHTLDVTTAIFISIERTLGLCTLLETHLDQCLFMETEASIPLETAIFCIRRQLGDIKSLLDTDPKPTQPEETSHEAA